MNEFPGVTFYPWIGSRYGRRSRFGIRLLVLGESHYGENIESKSFTTEVVKEWGQRRRARFFTIIANVMTGNRGCITDQDRAAVWEHVAFYNFVQSALSAPRKSPSFRQWVQAQDPFHTVLKILRPDAVLVLGFGLDEHILRKPNGISFEVIGHPSSSRMRYDESIPAFQNLIEKAGRRIPL